MSTRFAKKALNSNQFSNILSKMGMVNIHTPTAQLKGEYQSDNKKEKCLAKRIEHKINYKLEGEKQL